MSDKVPYRTYSFAEFQALAKHGTWPGANVAGIGYVAAAIPLPPKINHVVNTGRRLDISEVAEAMSMGADLSSIFFGGIEHGKFGSIRFRMNGQFAPAYYPYKEHLRGGWNGGGRSNIKTYQLSGNGGLAATASRGLLIVSTMHNTYVGFDAWGRNKPGWSSIAMKSGIDFFFSLIATYGGLFGFVIGSAYFVITTFQQPGVDVHKNAFTTVGREQDMLRVDKEFTRTREKLMQVENYKKGKILEDGKNPVLKASPMIKRN